MNRTSLMCAAATAALVLTHQPLAHATQTGDGASVYSAGDDAGAGYFVGDDGVIRYGTAPESTPAATEPVGVSLEQLEDAFATPGVETGTVYEPFPDSGIYADGPAISDYNPVDQGSVTIDSQVVPMETLQTESLSGTYEYTTDSTVSYDTAVGSLETPVYEAPTVTETVTETYTYVAPTTPPAAMAAPEASVFDDIPSGYDAFEELPVATQGYEYDTIAPQAQSGAYVVGTDDTVMMSEDYATETLVSEPLPMMSDPVYSDVQTTVSEYVEPTVVDQMYSEPTFVDPGYAEPMFAEPAYSEPSYTVTSHAAPDAAMTYTDVMAGLPDYVDAAPMSGADFAARGDGSYGPSTFKQAGEGPAAQSKRVYISKSTVVSLPVEASEIIVADPDLVRAVLRTAKETVLIGLRAGSTNVSFLDEDGNQILELTANVEYDLRPLRAALVENFPNVPVEVRSLMGEVIISGTPSSSSDAEAVRAFVRRYMYAALLSAGIDAAPSALEFTDNMRLASDDQVLVKVRIAEMRRSAIKQFGVDFNLASDTALTALTSNGTNLFGNAANIRNAFGANGSAMGGIAATIAGSLDGAKFGGLVRAFEQHNVMRVLAEPTLTAVSGETASFLAGGEFPYPTSVEDGQVGYTFRDFGVALEFTPVVLSDGRISLTVATEVSELTNDGALTTSDFTIPGISVRRANTTVELPSGGTMSIAGMLLQRDAASHTGLPGLKNVPIVGQLLSSSDYLKRETELVILVTPYLAKPRQEREFRLPTDGFAPASDFDLFVMGRLHKVYGRGDQDLIAAKRALKSPFGFIIE